MTNHILFPFILLAIVISAKWIAFICLSPIMRIMCYKDAKKKKDCSDNSGKKSAPMNVKNRLTIHIRKVTFYIRGYMRYMDFQTGLIPSHHIRNFIYRRIFLVQMEQKVIICWGAEIRCPGKLKIGKGSIIGDKALLDARNGITIGKNVNFSSNISIYTECHYLAWCAHWRRSCGSRRLRSNQRRTAIYDCRRCSRTKNRITEQESLL